MEKKRKRLRMKYEKKNKELFEPDWLHSEENVPTEPMPLRY